MNILTLCWTLIVINTFTIGGGYAMLPLLQKEFVDKHHWLTKSEFIDSIAIGQISPGPLTVMNAFIGYRIGGITAALLAVVSSYLPSMIIVAIATKYYYAYRQSALVSAAFAGIKPAVTGLLASVAVSLTYTSAQELPTMSIAAASFALITFTKIDPTFIILGSGLAGLFIF